MITSPSRIALGASCTYPHQPHYIKKPRLMAGQRVDRDWIQSMVLEDATLIRRLSLRL